MKRTLSLLALAVLALAGAELFALHLLRPLENRLLDRFVKSQAATLAPDPDIVLIEIDQKGPPRKGEQPGLWPWSPARYVRRP